MPQRDVKKSDFTAFGVIANPAKVSNGFLAELHASLPAWRLAQAAKGKKLQLIFIDQRYEQKNIRDRIQSALPGLKIDFVTPANHLGYLKAVGQLDLTLDTWPYSGGLTTIEALAMGVPSLTRSGRLFCERHTESHCYYAGMDLRECTIENFTGLSSQTPMGRSLLTKNSPRLDHDGLANELLFYFHAL
jgi:hypothetical protein